MAQYCSDAQLTYWFGNPSADDWPDAFDSAAERLSFITRASARVDALAGGMFTPSNTYGDGSAYQRFPEYDDSPATPELIADATSMFAAAELARAVGMASHLLIVQTDLREEAERIMQDVREGVADIYSSATGTGYGESGVSSSIDDDAELEFTSGQRDSSGNLLSDEAGSMDDYTGGRFG